MAGLALVAAVLTLLVEAPRRVSGPESVRGPRVLRVAAPGIRAIEVTLREHHVVATRDGAGWLLDGAPAPPPAVEAIDALATSLAEMRALDAFRTHDEAQFGLDRPEATIVVRTARGERRLALGRLNAAGGALYAQRDGHPRVFLVGVGMLSALQRVFYQRDAAMEAAAGR